MSSDPRQCDHCYCKKGLFYDVEPLHTHSHREQKCDNCRRSGTPADFPVSRCTGCCASTYCSEECQQEAWRKGHKSCCKFFTHQRDIAAAHSGNPRAWADLMDWIEFHHDTFRNATLACYLKSRPEEKFPAVTNDNIVVIQAWYRNDPALPVGTKFAVRGAGYLSKTDPSVKRNTPAMNLGYQDAVANGKAQLGKSYRGTGSYLVVVRFRPGDHSDRPHDMVVMSFVKHFDIDDRRAARDYPSAVARFQDGRPVAAEDGHMMTYALEVTPIADKDSSMMPNICIHIFIAKCRMATYCSEECQRSHWRSGHKVACRLYAAARDRAILLSGNKEAWLHFSSWVKYHEVSLINSTIACYLQRTTFMHDRVMTEEHLLHVMIQYRNDPSLPLEKQFEMRGASFTSMGALRGGALSSEIARGRAYAVENGKAEMGDRYWGTGTYLLTVRFGATEAIDGLNEIPFWKHFGISVSAGNARPLCHNSIGQLGINLSEGKKIYFSCRKSKRFPTYDCGGWMHETVGVFSHLVSTFTQLRTIQLGYEPTPLGSP
ncbi:hypothetical protein EVG20_g8861 [Dentipellis fragilis]|uniref:MYND-type domain-containing protein n=1 Tax=Dentipellis fragilis TaxID=205917 RepID=A0A4Y9Y4A7_9AGAM|nr:hypothetical protein EVG20_g8861 [Dentipellis fragilis]